MQRKRVLQLSEEDLRLEKLENDRQFLFKKVEKLQSEIQQEKATTIALRELNDLNTLDYTREKNVLMEEATSFKLELDNSNQQKNTRIQELEAKTEAQERYIADLEKKLQAVKPASVPKPLLKQVVVPAVSLKEENILLNQLSQNLNHVSSLEKEIRKLEKEINHYKTLDYNLLKKQEEISSLNNQIAQLSSLRGELAQVQAQNGLLLQEKARWFKFCQDEQGIVDPVTLTRSLAKCRLESAQLKQEIGEERVEKAEKQGYISRLEREASTLKEKIKELEKVNQNLKKESRVHERGKKLALRESEFLRNQLESFDLEQDLNGNALDDKKVQRIQELEKLLDCYKEDMNSLTECKVEKRPENVSKNNDYSTQSCSTISNLKNEISALKIENGMLEKQAASYEAQVHELQRALGRGEVDFSEQKVLMLKENPSAKADKTRYEELLALRSENEALRSSISTVPMESVKVFEMKISELQHDLFAKEKRMMRLKEVLNTQVQEFRASICSVLGFKIDMQPHGKLKLSSIYSSKWTLEFDTQGNFLGFVGANTDRLQNGIVKYLERSHVPAFMAWLTLHLFESSD